MARTLIDLAEQAKDGSLTQIKMAAGAITNTEVNGSAAIALSKLAAAADWDVNGALKAGVVNTLEMAAGAVTNSEVDAAAAIAYSKLNLSLSILDADVSAGAAIALSKLAVAADWDTAGALKAGVVSNVEISASAAIAWTKIAPLAQNAVVVGDVSSAATVIDTDLAGDISASSVSGLKYKLGSIINEDIGGAAAIATSKLANGADFLQKGASATIGTAVRYTYAGTPVFSNANDIVNRKYVDDNISGQSWKNPSGVLHLVGNATPTVINGLTVRAGDAYVVTAGGTLTRGTLAVLAGDVVEDDGTNWILIRSGAGGFVADGFRAILTDDQPGRVATALISPYVDATDDGKLMQFDGTSLTGADSGDAVNKAALIISDTAHVGLYDSFQYVYQGAVPTGQWVQTNGAATIVAGQGLTKSTNTIDAGDVNKGIQVNLNDFEFDASEASHASGGLAASANSWQLKVNVEASNPSLQITANELGIKLGTGLSKDVGGARITNTAVAAAAYGSATSVGSFTVNAQGQLTAAADIAIQLASSAKVTGLDSALALKADESLWTGKGVVVGASAAGTPLGLAAGTNAYTLVANSAAPSGLAWAATTSGQTSDREDPGEVPNNIITDFTVANAPIAGTEHVWLNGVLQEDAGADYTITGVTITFVSAPKTGDRIRVTYRY